MTAPSMPASLSARSERKATVSAPSNIAFIKYWGARDFESVRPENASISMTLRDCVSRSTVEHLDGEAPHEILWRGTSGSLETPPPGFAERVVAHLDRLRDTFDVGGHFRLATENTFPAAAGIASSASGFAALTLATLGALGEELPMGQRSVLARRSGSGSAARSVMGGYVEWPHDAAWIDQIPSSDASAKTPEETSEATAQPDAAVQIQPADHWDLRDVIALVETGAKETSSLDGHRRARTSPYFEARLSHLPERLAATRRAIEERDFDTLGPVIEEEAIDLHTIAMTSSPAIFYWAPGTLEVLAAVRALRRDGFAAWSTMDAGANVHVICQPDDEDTVAERLQALDSVHRVLRDGVGAGPVRETHHLF